MPTPRAPFAAVAIAFLAVISSPHLVADASKILFLYPHDSMSHLGSMKPLIRAIIQAGHDVTILQTGDDETATTVDGARVILWTLRGIPDCVDLLNRKIWTIIDHSDKHAIYADLMEKFFGENIRQMPDKIRQLLAEDWDLLVCDVLFTNHGFAFTQLLWHTRGVPYIIFHSTFVFQYISEALAFGGSWSAQSCLWGHLSRDSHDVYRPRSFLSRLPNFVETFLEVFGMNWLLHHFSMQHIRKFTTRPYTQEAFARDSALLVVDEMRGFGHVTPRTSRFLAFSAFCEPPGVLPQWLADFVEDEKSKGTIYVAFGTMIRFKYAPAHIRDAFYAALNALVDYRVVFSARGDAPSHAFGAHVKVVSWAPQTALLAHPKTKLFISHGGLKSFKEAVCVDCPMAILPFFAEQSRNAMAAARLGFATILNKFTLDRNRTIVELLKVLEDDRYAERMRRLHATFHDNVIDPADELRFQVARVLRRKGTRLRHANRGEQLAIIPYFNLHLFLIFVLVIFAVFY